VSAMKSYPYEEETLVTRLLNLKNEVIEKFAWAKKFVTSSDSGKALDERIKKF
jgi:hypothetical protein